MFPEIDRWWLDTASDQLYVVASYLGVFNNISTTNGSILPARFISALSPTPTTFYIQGGLWLDAASDQMYVLSSPPNYYNSYSSILVFTAASTISGDVAPARVISGAKTALNSPNALWLDSTSDQLYVSSGGNSVGNGILNEGGNCILVFTDASTINGDVAPARVISGTTTGLKSIVALWVDATSDQIYALSSRPPSYYKTNSSILVFTDASTISGDIAPARVISGTTTELSEARAFWLDAVSDQLYVSNGGNNNILVFNNASTINGDVAPARVISGTTTGLNFPDAMWLDTASDQLYVSTRTSKEISSKGSRVLVFTLASTINGNIAPSRIIGLK